MCVCVCVCNTMLYSILVRNPRVLSVLRPLTACIYPYTSRVFCVCDLWHRSHRWLLSLPSPLSLGIIHPLCIYVEPHLCVCFFVL